MGEPLFQEHIDNDNADPKGRNNDNDNVPTLAFRSTALVDTITEYRLDQIDKFLFGGGHTISDCSQFINPALKKMEQFMCSWVCELSEESRKAIVCQWYDKKSPKDAYKMYLNSPLWKYQSGLFKAFYGFTCQECHRAYPAPHLVVHHLSYEHIGSEFAHLEDVTLLCTDCHREVHKTKGDK